MSLCHAQPRSFSRGVASASARYVAFCDAALGDPLQPCTYEEVLPATDSAALMLLSLLTDNLSRHVPAALALAAVQAGFAVHLLRWPSNVLNDADDRCARHAADAITGYKEHRLAQLLRAELKALRDEEEGLENAVPPPLPCPFARHPRFVVHRTCLHCACALPAFGPMPLCAACFAHEAMPLLATVLASCAADLSRWRLSVESHGAAPDGTEFDFLNEFGRHALPADDAAFCGAEYQRALLAHASGRSSVDVAPRAGPLRSSLFGEPLDALLGPQLSLAAVTGSGSEAVRRFWEISSAYTGAYPAHVLVLRGSYCGGAGELSAASGLAFLREHAFAAAARADVERFVVDAPYVPRLDLEAGAEAAGAEVPGAEAELGVGTDSARTMAQLSMEEVRCLAALEERWALCAERGDAVGGVLLELTRASDGASLSRPFVRAVAEWAAARRLLLFEDAVLMGLRCGRPYASAFYGVEPAWVAVGKLFGFSGVLHNAAACHHGGYGAHPEQLNGYLTCAIAPLEVVRCRVILRAIVERRLCESAGPAGRRLKAHLRAQGLEVWGTGLALWFAPESGCIANAYTLFNRMLPTLTFDADGKEHRRIRVRKGLYSHLPSLFALTLSGNMEYTL